MRLDNLKQGLTFEFSISIGGGSLSHCAMLSAAVTLAAAAAAAVSVQVVVAMNGRETRKRVFATVQCYAQWWWSSRGRLQSDLVLCNCRSHRLHSHQLHQKVVISHRDGLNSLSSSELEREKNKLKTKKRSWEVGSDGRHQQSRARRVECEADVMKATLHDFL